jgi:hypothetical protein
VAEFWLAEPSGLVTTVQLVAAQPGWVSITRKRPAPL